MAYDEVDDILFDWFTFSKMYQPALGYGRADSTCRDFTISRQWMEYDELSEMVDHKLREGVAKAVEPLIFELTLRQRMAIQTAMRNMDAGRTVWTNPRYPETQESDYTQAKEALRPKLFAKGLLNSPCKPCADKVSCRLWA
jgi:hypothetical protein